MSWNTCIWVVWMHVGLSLHGWPDQQSIWSLTHQQIVRLKSLGPQLIELAAGSQLPQLGSPCTRTGHSVKSCADKFEACSQPRVANNSSYMQTYSYSQIWPIWLKISNIYHINIRTSTMYSVSNPVKLNPVSLQFTPNCTSFGSGSKWTSEWIPIFPSGPALLSRLLSHLGINRVLFLRACQHSFTESQMVQWDVSKTLGLAFCWGLLGYVNLTASAQKG